MWSPAGSAPSSSSTCRTAYPLARVAAGPNVVNLDLVAVNGYYDVVSMTLNVAHVKPPAEAEMPFKQAGQ